METYKCILPPRLNIVHLKTIQELADITQNLSLHKYPALMISGVKNKDDLFINFIKLNKNLFSKVPFCIVSAIDNLDTMREFYQLGAHHYFVFPLKNNEFLAKIEQILNPPLASHISFQNNNKLNFYTDNLTSKESKILKLLIESENHSAHRDDICNKVWHGVNVQGKTLDVHLCNMRIKLEPKGIKITSEGKGFYSLILPKE